MTRLSRRDGTRVNQRVYTVPIESDTANDEEISYRALGLLVHMLNKPADWQMRSEQLSKGKKREGRDAVRKVLHELAAGGYYRLERRRFRDGKHAMGTAISFYAVEQWKKDYVTFDGELAVPVVEQEDGSFQVLYPDGSTGSDGFGQGRDEPPADDEPEPPADDEQEPSAPPAESTTPRRKTPPAAKKAAAPKQPPAPAKNAREPEKGAEEKQTAAAQKAAEKALLDADAEEVAKWWWADAEKRFGPYVGDKRGYIAMRNQVRSALEKGYTKNQCGKALIQAQKHWPSAQQWQQALGIVTNHIQPRNTGGRVPYSDASTWGGQGEAPSNMPGATNAPPPGNSADDDADDATFGIVERP
ncbi:hypothetical protein [Streptomyces cahuitamycinicus]|uniref:Uncharacterized protein n=1 Tax=Streptomyces cahuitamycinicus TaxID=2070367 RepID=A0A2N8THZ0_9ACTN|nr:hypothetical protein [Streptomyces cahuitamycinicus]PNG18594.1 hypothetical protein C1J00_30275 [Streptomyces cahuitamycinicus]